MTWLLHTCALQANDDFGKAASEDGTEGSKRRLTWLLADLASQRGATGLWDRIADVLVKTVVSAQPELAHAFKAVSGGAPHKCFELLGFDIMLDHKLRPWLIEVWHK